MKTYPFRLTYGADLKESIEEHVRCRDIQAGYVITLVGSLARVAIRTAGAKNCIEVESDFEIVSAEGTLSIEGCHIHISVSDEKGATIGGHLLAGCIVRTTAEVILAEDDSYKFHRTADSTTGFKELLVSPKKTIT